LKKETNRLDSTINKLIDIKKIVKKNQLHLIRKKKRQEVQF
jgi:hypothetical protein